MDLKKFFVDKKNQKNLKIIVNTFATTKLYGFKIVRFQDRTHQQQKFRYWLTFKIADEAFCFLSTFTTKDTLAMLYRNDDNALNSLVFIPKGTFYPPFAENTYLDCNIQDIKHRRTFKELNEKHIDWSCGLEEVKYSLPESLRDDIVKAIVNSDFTAPEIKEGFKKAYPHLFNLNKVSKNFSF